MQTFKLFDKSSAYSPFYAMLIVTRFQLLYFVLLMPMYLVQPYMIWGILLMGVLSHLNILVLSKYFSTRFAQNGYEGFTELLSEPLIRIFSFFGLGFIFIKMTVITLSYMDIVNQYIFPYLSTNWLIVILMLTSLYIASQGMSKTIRFVVIVFFCTVWIPLMYVPFTFPPYASIYDLFPLIPKEIPHQTWKGLLIIWSSLSGPEYLICFLPWFKPQQKMFKYLSIANAYTIVEYIGLFVATLLFFGPNLLRTSHLPVINMIRYLQTVVFERIDVILISAHMFLFIYANALFLLCFYGGARILMKRVLLPTRLTGFIWCSIFLILGITVINYWFWKPGRGIQLNSWQYFQVWMQAISFFIVPSFLWMVSKIKGRSA
ncbi:GerAB/ArcD/ProY family transporter [Peribacillus muralis]|uniref:GerAB/ArcD/ProY family transporter n=1 Tax=Peribacillus muralis TaxID=264697 RepID=UPI001F4D4992|nr:GerAB/ArcD/ProY family transporter [Peribacillus muralis]MCK1995287.1 GerAB/ArcD/ProY family transporter [Peribacillus muralis]MCK2015957.1 GerAB/ArcD/ProY family transporter [Peribacillus muralis]